MSKKPDTEFTYTVDDLGKFDFGGTALAVIGHPIQHSVSPAMHNAAIKKLCEQESRFNDWAYFRFDVPPEAFAGAVPRFFEHNFLGLNLTIPHKVQAMELIKGISPDAERMGAVNTLVWNEFGYDGFNTDGYGLKKGLLEDLDFDLKNGTVILLGSGGAARAAAVQCVLDGCKKLYVGNRTPSRLDGLMEIVHEMPGGQCAEAFALNTPPRDLPETGVLINATSLGLKTDDPAPFDVALLPDGWKVYDMIYNPAATKLLEEAGKRGLATANGLSMLVHQGARSLEIWSKTEVNAHSMMAAACHALKLPPRY
ncbi:shikimate dehydrogenase [Coraliomargarita sinensis]|uniref:Shikimate dehydrogenase (NADP(+)) n=1 Tax=Coraliomargarita sinensis TaxID=2174842 RepID=A0A317ZG50_9BACT|nr:shikimate dehydrogenase [Coraliomargarita sinensis]PXA03193.1 shikimate dehydrogenase [Coraliomargarita sinensis]